MPTEDFLFGEYKKVTFNFKNVNPQKIDKLIVISSNPLCSGFFIEEIKDFENKQKFEYDFYIRATMIKNQEEVNLLFIYQTNGYIRNFLSRFSLHVKPSYKIKCFVERLGTFDYLLSLNFISQNP